MVQLRMDRPGDHVAQNYPRTKGNNHGCSGSITRISEAEELGEYCDLGVRLEA